MSKRMKMNFTSPAAEANIRAIERALTTQALSRTALAAAVGLGRSTTGVYIQHLRPRLHVARHDWDDSTTPIPLYAWGVGPDADPPRRREDVVVADKPAVVYGNLRPRRDPMTAAFFGAAHA